VRAAKTLGDWIAPMPVQAAVTERLCGFERVISLGAVARENCAGIRAQRLPIPFVIDREQQG
jgi:hypothetical protein